MSLDEIQSIKESLARIETALMGDPAMGNKGLVMRVRDLEQQCDDTSSWRNGVQAKITVISSAVAVVAAAIVQGIVSYFSSNTK